MALAALSAWSQQSRSYYLSNWNRNCIPALISWIASKAGLITLATETVNVKIDRSVLKSSKAGLITLATETYTRDFLRERLRTSKAGLITLATETLFDLRRRIMPAIQQSRSYYLSNWNRARRSCDSCPASSKAGLITLATETTYPSTPTQ